MSDEIFPSEVRGVTYTVVKSQENSVLVQEAPSFVSTRILQAQNPRWHWKLQYEVLFDNILYPNPNYTYTDFQIMMGFCQARYSNYDDFLYLDPDDNSIGPGVITATWQANYPYALGTVVIASAHAQQVVSASAGAKSGSTTPAFSVVGGTVIDGGLTWLDLGAIVGAGWPNPQATLQIVTDGLGNYYSPIQRNLGGQFWEDITDLASALLVYDNGTLVTNYTVTTGGLALSGVSTSGLVIAWNAQPTGPVTATFNFFFRVVLEEPVTDFEKFVNEMWAIGGDQGSSGKGYIKFRSSTIFSRTGTGAAPVTWTGSAPGIARIPPPIPNPGPNPGPPSGGAGTTDMLTWVLMQLPDRQTFYLKGTGNPLYMMLDTDAGYPGSYPAGVFFWMKNSAGHPWDVEKYDGTYIYHWMTENNDPVAQPACHAAGYSKCFVDPFAYKRLLTPVPFLPRIFTLGSTVTIDSPSPNTSHRTTNCETNFILGNLGDIRCTTTGPFTMNWGGTVGSQPTIQNDYYYGGKIATGNFTYLESTFFVQNTGRVCWKYFIKQSGVYQLQQTTLHANKTSFPVPTPSFPCGPGMPWF